jgi:PmbA protein
MKRFWEAFLIEAKKQGIEEVEMMMQRSKNFSINVYEAELEKYQISEDGGYAFRGKVKGKMGSVYTELLDAELIEELVEALIENAEAIDSTDPEFLYPGTGQGMESDLRKENKGTEAEKIQFAMDLERAALQFDPRIRKVTNSFFAEQESEYQLLNSHGLVCSEQDRYFMAYSYLTAEEENDRQTAFAFQLSRDFHELNPETIAKEAAVEAISILHPKRIPSGSYEAILENRVVVDFLESFGSIFSADAVQKGLSRMKGKLNEQVASKLITLVDDPTGAVGFLKQPFDSEGVETQKKKVVDQGILTTYLHNLKTAHKAGIESTGNAHKSSYKGSMGISTSNFYLEPGERSKATMMEAMKQGVLITEVQGLHSGLNPVSGDFSLAASGFLIKDGLKDHAIHQITIAGNWFQLLQEIQEVGADIWFGIPSGGHFGAPSIWLKTLSVAGE